MRILDKDNIRVGQSASSSLSEHDFRNFKTLIRRPNVQSILVTGPTGSGKTHDSLSLAQRAQPAPTRRSSPPRIRSSITSRGINQVEVTPNQNGLDFARGHPRHASRQPRRT